MRTRTRRWARLLKRFWNWARPIAVLVIVISSLRSAVADWNDVPTGSMEPTILRGDRIFVNKLAYDLKAPFSPWRLIQWSDPQRGHVVICYSPADGTRLVKRVIGLPGDLIEMRDHKLMVNGQTLDYAPLDVETLSQIDAGDRSRRVFAAEKLGEHTHPVMITPQLRTPRSFTPLTVPAGHYFVMGDNRDESFDSRRFGCVPRDQIVGRAVRIILSLDRDRCYVPRWWRFFHPLP